MKAVIAILLTYPGIDINATIDGDTALIMVMDKPWCVDIVRILLRVPNIDLDARGPSGQTALDRASEFNNTKFVELIKPAIDTRKLRGTLFPFRDNSDRPYSTKEDFDFSKNESPHSEARSQENKQSASGKSKLGLLFLQRAIRRRQRAAKAPVPVASAMSSLPSQKKQP